jgi:hypothetical protein
VFTHPGFDGLTPVCVGQAASVRHFQGNSSSIRLFGLLIPT